MNHFRLVPVLGVCCLAISLSPIAARAKDFHSMRLSFKTTGKLSWAGQSQSVGRVRVELDEDGDARLKFDNEERDWNWGWRESDWKNWDQNLELDGLWVRDERGVSIDLRRGFGGQNIVGTAHITTDDNRDSRPSGLSLSGRIVRRPWDTVDLNGQFTFGAWNGSANTRDNRLDELSAIKRGSGQFSDDGQTSDLSKANVELSRDGTAKVTLSGEREYSFEGRWRQTSATRIELRLDTFASQNGPQFDAPRAQRDADSLGGGEIRLNGTKITSLRLSGTRGNRDFEAKFQPQTGGGNWNGNNGLPAPNPVLERNGGGNWNGNGGGNWNLPAPNPVPDRNNGDEGWNGNAVNGNQAPAPEPEEPAQERPKSRPRPRKPEPLIEETPPPVPDPIRASWQGTATLKRSDGNETFSRASVSLEPTGLGTLRVGAHKLFGRWRQTGANTYSLNLENGASRCTANIKLNGGKIVGLQISGQLDNAQTNLNLNE